jgi:hypothetical protein
MATSYLKQLTPEQVAQLDKQNESVFGGLKYNRLQTEGHGGEGGDWTPASNDGYTTVDYSKNPYGTYYDYDTSGKFIGTHEGEGASWLNKAMPGLILGAATAGLGIPGMVGNALNTSFGLGLGTAGTAALGGAVVGGGTAALTGGNPLLGAALGGAGGYASGSGMFGGNNGYNFNGPEVTGPTLNELNGTAFNNPTTSDLMGGGSGGAGSGGYDPITNTKGYYDQITGKFIYDPNGGLDAPLDNTSGTNLGSMSGYSYDPASGTWTMPDGTQVATTPGNPYKSASSGADVLKSAGAGLAGAGVAGGGAAAGGGLLGPLSTGNTVADLALINGGVGLVNNALTKNAISDALNTTTAAANTSNSTLKDIYNSQLNMVKPYQDLGVNAIGLINKNGDYFTHQFDASDLQKGLAPNYDFMLQQGQMANQRAANMGGGAIGGNALQGLNKFTQDYAGNAYQNAFTNYQNQRNNIYNNLSNAAGIGSTANQQIIGAGNTYGTNTTNLATGLAAAQAGATIGQNQNTTNLLNNLTNNVTLASLLNQKSTVGP